jgi:hypothetical protein
VGSGSYPVVGKHIVVFICLRSMSVDDESQQLIVKNNLLGVVILDRCKAIFPHLEMLSVRIPLGDEYSIQHYVIMFVGDGCFFSGHCGFLHK